MNALWRPLRGLGRGRGGRLLLAHALTGEATICRLLRGLRRGERSFHVHGLTPEAKPCASCRGSFVGVYRVFVLYCSLKVSPGTVSELNKKIYAQIERWRNRPHPFAPVTRKTF